MFNEISIAMEGDVQCIRGELLCRSWRSPDELLIPTLIVRKDIAVLGCTLLVSCIVVDSR